MNSLERKTLIEQTGFKIKNNEIVDLKTKEQLKKTEQDNIAKKYKSTTSEIYIKGINEITIKRKDTIIKIKEKEDEQIITLKDKDTKIKIITTLEKMMYKIGSIKIIEIANETTTTEYIQRIEKTEINNFVLCLRNTTPQTIRELLTKNMKTKKIEILKPIIEENAKKIIDYLNENLNIYIESLEKSQPNEKIKLNILKQYKGL